ncbi:hypothetical protein [Vibrio sinaloensis]|uniref:hypothetical protein n=1 Tax=Photobacterium sp. (strain ATCC 43367) TaxID=379097 RepID=UPI002F418AB7
MLTSDIIVTKEEKMVTPSSAQKLIEAYRSERTRQEITEVELNRTKIVMIDEDGNMKKVPLLAEH